MPALTASPPCSCSWAPSPSPWGHMGGAAVGLAITAAIVIVGYQAALSIGQRLLDAVDPAIIDRIEGTVAAVDGVVAVTEVRARWMGHRLLAQVRLSVDGCLSPGHTRSPKSPSTSCSTTSRDFPTPSFTSTRPPPDSTPTRRRPTIGPRTDPIPPPGHTCAHGHSRASTPGSRLRLQGEAPGPPRCRLRPRGRGERRGRGRRRPADVQAVTVLAERKASAVAPLCEHALVLGCDSLLELDGDSLGKPASAPEIVAMWRRLSSRQGRLHTGHCLIDTRSGRRVGESPAR